MGTGVILVIVVGVMSAVHITTNYGVSMNSKAPVWTHTLPPPHPHIRSVEVKPCTLLHYEIYHERTGFCFVGMSKLWIWRGEKKITCGPVVQIQGRAICNVNSSVESQKGAINILKKIHWEPEGGYHCTKSMAIMLFWFLRNIFEYG